jgi:hypothetical protein
MQPLVPAQYCTIACKFAALRSAIPITFPPGACASTCSFAISARRSPEEESAASG